MLGLIILGIILLILLIVIVSNVKVVPQAHAYVIERLGTYHVTWSTGLHVKIPFIDKISKKVSLKEQVIDFPPQPVITRDNVTMQIDTVVYFEITDPKLYTYGVDRSALLKILLQQHCVISSVILNLITHSHPVIQLTVKSE